MAGFGWRAVPGEISTGTAKKTVLQISAPATQDVEILYWSISADDITPADDPIYVELEFQADTPAGSSLVTLGKTNPAMSGTIETQAESNFVGSSQPADGELIDNTEINANGGGFVFGPAPQGQGILVPRGMKVGIVVTSAVNVHVTPVMWGVE